MQSKAACPVRDLVQDQFRAEVIRVPDGDTIVVDAPNTYSQDLISIRLLGIDTPETHYYGKSQGYWGDVASNRLKQLLPIGSRVIIELDKTRCDRFGRVLGYVFKQDTVFLNQIMLEESLAVNYCIAPNLKYCETFGKIVEKNIEKHSGMFGDRKLLIPYEWRRRESNRLYEKFVGNIETRTVYQPRSVHLVPIWARVFFIYKDQVKAPYEFAEN